MHNFMSFQAAFHLQGEGKEKEKGEEDVVWKKNTGAPVGSKNRLGREKAGCRKNRHQ